MITGPAVGVQEYSVSVIRGPVSVVDTMSVTGETVVGAAVSGRVEVLIAMIVVVVLVYTVPDIV